MNCPKCGSRVQSGQKFCRACGDSLQIITQPLATPAAIPAGGNRSGIVSRDQRPQSNAVFWGFIVMFLGAALGVIGKMIVHWEVLTAVGALTAMVGMFLIAYPSLTSLRRGKAASTSPSPEQLPAAQPVERLLPTPGDTDFVPSVTERTTNLLQTQPRASKDDHPPQGK